MKKMLDVDHCRHVCFLYTIIVFPVAHRAALKALRAVLVLLVHSEIASPLVSCGAMRR